MPIPYASNFVMRIIPCDLYHIMVWAKINYFEHQPRLGIRQMI